jgi:hypothetical protein
MLQPLLNLESIAIFFAIVNCAGSPASGTSTANNGSDFGLVQTLLPNEEM